MKKAKAPKFAHTADTKFGMGDYYGTGIRAKLGKVKSSMIGEGGIPMSKAKLRKPPKSVV